MAVVLGIHYTVQAHQQVRDTLSKANRMVAKLSWRLTADERQLKGRCTLWRAGAGRGATLTILKDRNLQLSG